MDPARIEHLVGLMARHAVARLVWREAGSELTLVRLHTPSAPRRAASEPVVSPFMGRLCWQHPSAGDGAAQPSANAAGQAIAWIALGPVLRPVRVPAVARVLQRLLPDGAVVGYGDTLAHIASLHKD